MNFIGVDLHKKSITICVMDEKRKVLARKTLACTQTDEIVEFFRQFRPFKVVVVVVEATASYLWFVELVEPLAEKVVLANPKKLRVIAESTGKNDELTPDFRYRALVRARSPRNISRSPSGGNPVSVHHSCPKRRTDTGLRGSVGAPGEQSPGATRPGTPSGDISDVTFSLCEAALERQLAGRSRLGKVLSSIARDLESRAKSDPRQTIETKNKLRPLGSPSLLVNPASSCAKNIRDVEVANRDVPKVSLQKIVVQPFQSDTLRLL